MTEPREIPASTSENAAAAASQLSILLSAARNEIDDEFKRSERLDAKSRNQVAIVGTFFAVVQAAVISLLNGILSGSDETAQSSFVPWLAGLGGVAAALTFTAVALSYQAWRLRDDPALSISTIEEYIDYARDGNRAVGALLIQAYATVAKGRRSNNEIRAKSVDNAAVACLLAFVAIAGELVLAFIAAAVQ